MKIIFLTGYSISHIYPLEAIVRFMSKEHDVYMVCTDKNKWLPEKWNIKTIIYPAKYWDCKYSKELKEFNNEILKNNNTVQAQYIQHLKKDALSTFNFFEDVIVFLKNIINEIKPDIVFKDSTDIYWETIKKDFDTIRTIGFITNNLYSWSYLQDLDKLIHFLGVVTIENDLDEGFINNFRKNIDNIFREVSIEFEEHPLRTYYQYDPQEEINIIFSMPFFQPMQSLEKKYQNYIITPEIENFLIEKSIPNKLKEFVEKEKIIYISTGSFITKDINYYEKIIDLFTSNGNNRIVISGGRQSEKIEQYVINSSLEETVIVYDHVPQKYILSNCKLFVCTGGFNSVKEAIFFKVPMLVIPITCEQRLNGLIIEDLGIGYTLYKKNQKPANILINDLLCNDKFGERLEIYSKKIINKKKNYDYYKEINKWITDGK